MRVMVLIKANKDSEAGILPSERLLTEMGKFNEELVNAGVMLAGEGLHPSSRGKYVTFARGKTTVTEGPSAETKDIVAGFWLWQVKSIEEAVEWVTRVPNPDGNDGRIEIRPVFEAEDFGASLTPELREQEDRLRAQIETKTAAEQAAAHGVHPVTPHLVCAGAADAIEFYKKAFGAAEMMRLAGPDGKIMHACVSINGSSVMLNDEYPAMGNTSPKTLKGTPVTIHLIVDDVDRFVAHAVEAGAKVVMPVADQFWGDRYGIIEDPFGHRWSVATPKRQMTMDEIHEAARTAMAR